MLRGIGTVLCFVSALFFPLPLTLLLSLVVGVREPLIPFAIGLFVDTLSYTPSLHTLPFATLLGAGASVALVMLRARLRTSSIG